MSANRPDDVVEDRGPRPGPAATRTGRRLALLTVAWNVAEAVVAVGAGAIAGSPALLGFGIDSVIESASGGVMLWRFGGAAEQRETRARKLVGVSLWLLAAYVAVEGSGALLRRSEPDVSLVGIALAALSVVAMPLLARAKRRANRGIASRAFHADSRQTDLCAWLSAILLAGLLLNAVLGWWWADPLASLCMVPIIAREGKEAFEGTGCACEDA